MKKLALFVCAAVLAMGLAGCGGSASSSAAASSSASDSASSAAASASAEASSAAASASASAAASADLTDFEWVAFEMPEGFEDMQESDNYVTIADSADNHRMMKVFRRTLSSSAPTAADYAAKEVAEHADKYTDEGKQTVGDYEWNLVGFTFNGNPSVYAYADAAEKKCVYVTVYEMTLDDPAVQTVLSSLTVDQSKL